MLVRAACPTCGVAGGGFMEPWRGIEERIDVAADGGAVEHMTRASATILKAHVKPGTSCGDVMCANGHVYCQRCYEPPHQGISWYARDQISSIDLV